MKQRKIYRESTVEWMKPRSKSMTWNTRKKRIQSEQQEKNQNKEDRIRSLWDNFKRTISQIIGVPEGEEKKQEIENLFEKVQEAQRVQNKIDTRMTTARHIIIKMPKVKDKERSSKAAREKAHSYLQRSSYKTAC